MLHCNQLHGIHFIVLCPETHNFHDDVIKWKQFPRYWRFVRGIHRSPVNSPYKGQWRRALMFSCICARINGWVNNGEVDYLRRHHAHYDITVMFGYPSLNGGSKYTNKINIQTEKYTNWIISISLFNMYKQRSFQVFNGTQMETESWEVYVPMDIIMKINLILFPLTYLNSVIRMDWFG